MKKIINKTTMAVILLLSMALALLGGIFFAKHNTVANAAGGTTVEITADTTSFCPGATFKLTVTLKTDRSGLIYETINFGIGPKSSTTGINTVQAGLLKFENPVYPSFTNATINNSLINTPDNYSATGNLFFSIACADDKISSNDNIVVVTVDVTIDENIDVANATPGSLDFEIGVRANKQQYVAFDDGSKDAGNTTLNVVPLKFSIKEPSNNNNLTSLKLGQGDDEKKLTSFDPTEASFDKDNIAITVTDPSLPLSVLPVTEDEGAKVTLKPGDIDVNSGDIGKINIPSDGIVRVVVTAENGDENIYTIKVKVVGAMLTALTAKTDTATAGVTKNGLKETFDSSTTAYTVYIPSDSTKVTFKATVSTGHNELTTLDLFTANGYTVPTSVNSGVDFDASGVSDGDTLRITCKASDGATNSSKDYVITFEIVDVDATLDTVTVVGTTTKKSFGNSTLRATANSVDYYFMVVGETNASSTVTLAATSSDATITLDGAEYTAAKTLTAGKYTVVVTAEAGNTNTYKVELKNYVPLELVDDSEYDFLFEEVEIVEEDGVTEEYYYRRAYKEGRQEIGKEGSLVHGIDDINFERVVIGQITDYTTVNDFLANFKNTSRIKLYSSDGTLLFNCGSVGDDVDPDELDDGDSYAVGTGWYIEYIVDGAVEETVYISVLGDMDGDGYITSSDIFAIGKFIRHITTFDKVEFRLAGYIVNEMGTMDAGDITEIGKFLKNQITMDMYFYKAS